MIKTSKLIKKIDDTGINSKILSADVGIAYTTLRDKLNEKSEFSLKEALLIANYFNTKIEDLFL